MVATIAQLEVSWLVQVGAVELALGALSGWAVAAAVERPRWLERIGVRAAPRLRQAHLDWILMGLILIGVGLAAPELPLGLGLPLAFGAWVNATLFVPLAFAPSAAQHRVYRAVTFVSFTAMSFGATAVAVYLLGA